ncbi:unnamed protein product, partial [Meganyctiphanes norvegica]
MRLRVRLKSLAILSVICCSILLYTFVDLHSGSVQDTNQRAIIARSTGLDLQSLGKRELSESVAENNKELIVVESKSYMEKDVKPELAENGSFHISQISPKITTQKAVIKKPPTPKSITECDHNCQLRKMRDRNRALMKQLMNSTKSRDVAKNVICDQKCRLAKLPKGKLLQRGYAARVQIENITLPGSWTVTQELVDRLYHRNSHLKEVCQKYGLDKESEENKLNAWEFLINKEYGLIWCNVFKAASSTWFYNFNLLSGYSEAQLLSAKETPISMARKKYPRPSAEQLKGALHNETAQPLSFMIVRNPLERFVSAYRDKILSGSQFYASISREIVKRYPDLGVNIMKIGMIEKAWKSIHRSPIPSFSQFTQYVIDDAAKGKKLNEHWTPMTQFCTPCLVNFDVIAKTETMEEDGNYIIFNAGIEHVIIPKRINRSRNGPTDVVAESFLCGLTEAQMSGLMYLFKYDIELFEYDVNKYVNCTRGKQ